MKLKISLVLLSLIFLSTTALAAPRYGIIYAQSLVGNKKSVPENVHGFRLGIWYQPEYLIWEKWRIYFDATAGHWWVTGKYSNSLNSYAIGPVLRLYLFSHPNISPFVSGSIALTYLTRTEMGNRNLGMHFSFQDQLGFGATFGQKQQLSLSLNIIHYSNACLSNHNSGFTAPLNLNVEYGFG